MVGFDFDAQPSLDPVPDPGTWDPAAGLSMATVMFLGKTHLAVALGREAIRQNYSVHFVTATTVVVLANAMRGSPEKQLTTPVPAEGGSISGSNRHSD
ncbi:ATP-binding protein [Mesorhizobium sp. M0676]|uniref:ATP-binding protein n=1 Tax=Mesorhizobium sp. M0676 TaxID=2956984 RepID=UPI00333D107F